MNLTMVVIGHLTNPFDLEGSFGVHFAATDFAADAAVSRASSRGFNLSVDAGGAKPSAVHFLIVRLSDGLRIEGYVDCPLGQRNHVVITGQFSAPDHGEMVGRFNATLHWDGTQGILSADWTLPRK